VLTQATIDSLNEQINLEFYSSNLYLQMSAWCDFKGFAGCAAFLSAHAQEEMDHMRRLFTYVNETGALAKLGQIDAPPTEFQSLVDVFEKVLEHEQEVTRAINGLAHTAFQQQDYSTFNFLQWYVAEQHEEETLFKGILDKFEILGTDGKALFLLDQELARLGAAAVVQSAAPAGDA
jgi:ferritin